MTQIALAFRFARREMRLRLAGFRIFFACLALGVTAIAGVGSLSQAFLTGLAEQGRTLLGGDVVVHLVHREARGDELRYLQARGRISEIVSMRAMAYALKNGAEAERTGRGIALEDLGGIRDRVRLRRPQRVTLHSWAFHQLGAFVAYKAARAVVATVYVDPAYTSQGCSHCGHVADASNEFNPRH